MLKDRDEAWTKVEALATRHPSFTNKGGLPNNNPFITPKQNNSITNTNSNINMNMNANANINMNTNINTNINTNTNINVNAQVDEDEENEQNVLSTEKIESKTNEVSIQNVKLQS